MWWAELAALDRRLSQPGREGSIEPSASVHETAIVDETDGPVVIGARSRVCSGAVIKGPITIGDDCLVGSSAMLRGPAELGENVRIGFAAEIKHCVLGSDTSVGPQSFVADSVIEAGVYLGAQVRTSNHRLDRQTIKVREGDLETDTGLDKLGCHIGCRASLGIQVIVLPGRVIAPDTLVGPRVTIEKNLPSGRYRLAQQLSTY